jgi:sulfane dehydrogenase subunit SoxC
MRQGDDMHRDDVLPLNERGGLITKPGGGEKEFGRLRRRSFLIAATAAVAATPTKLLAAAETTPADPTKEPGRPTGEDGGYGTPSTFEKARRLLANNPNALTTWTFTPLADLVGNVTPSGLHYERHHGGIPLIDPLRHSLVIHGLVKTPKRFSMADLKRFPPVSRRHFIECSGNTLSEWSKPTAPNVQVSHGLLSTSEWTGVAVSTLLRETGILDSAKWVVAEGSDAAMMTRSTPIDKMLSDAILAYGQNGEAIRPEQGYPLRLLLPGFEGNMSIKWLRRIQVSDKPFMTREETSRYTDLNANGIADQFVFTMNPKSVITSPSGGMQLSGPGPVEITGLAWSGRGRIQTVEVSIDGGSSWYPASLDSAPEPICTARFRFPWRWDGRPALIQSRCTDETGSVQPTHDELVALHGVNYVYYYNAIQCWLINDGGEVANAARS